MNLVDGVVLLVHSISNGEQPHIRRVAECIIQVGGFHNDFEALPARINLTDGLLQALLKCASDSHDFTDRLHRRAYFPVDLRRELGKIPFGDLRHDIIERRFEAGGRGLCYSIGELRKSVTKGNFGSSVRQRISGGLRSKGTNE